MPRCYAWLLIFEEKFILYPTDKFHDYNNDKSNDNRIVHIFNLIGFHIIIRRKLKNVSFIRRYFCYLSAKEVSQSP